jgi:hypothetical protein
LRLDIEAYDADYITKNFDSDYEINIQSTDLKDIFNQMRDRITKSNIGVLTEWVWMGNCRYSQVNNQLRQLYKPLSASSYIPLPTVLVNTKSIINIKNADNECFKWAVTRALNPVGGKAHPDRLTDMLRWQASLMNWSNITFPTKLENIKTFEDNNNRGN